MLTAPIPLKLYDDPAVGYAELAKTVAKGKKYEQNFDFTVIEAPTYNGKPRYLEEMYPKAIVSDGDIGSWEISQGSLAYCGTAADIAALAAVPLSSEWSMEKMIYPKTVSDIGLYLVRVRDPEGTTKPKWVAIDSRVPVKADGGNSVMQPQKEMSLLPPLLLKAACTMRGGCYDEITNSNKLGITFEWCPLTYEKVYDHARLAEILAGGGTCIITYKQQYDSGGAPITPPGIIYGHAFAIVDTISVPDAKLVRIENPHASGTDYVSAYSDDAPFWKTRPELAAKLEDSKQSTANYWIDWATLKSLIGSDFVEAKVFLPSATYPFVETSLQVRDGKHTPMGGWHSTWGPQLIKTLQPSQMQKIEVVGIGDLMVDVYWQKKVGAGDRYTRVRFLNEQGIEQALTSECVFGGRGSFVVKLPPGKYTMVATTRGMAAPADKPVDMGTIRLTVVSKNKMFNFIN